MLRLVVVGRARSRCLHEESNSTVSPAVKVKPRELPGEREEEKQAEDVDEIKISEIEIGGGKKGAEKKRASRNC